MLLKETDAPFDSEDYLFEIKFDGIRATIFASPFTFKIISRNRKDITNLYPELRSIQKLVRKDTIIDGEIVSFENNVPSFSKLQERSHLKDKRKIQYQSIINPVVFVAFDILYQDKDLIDLKLTQRKKILDKIEENEVFIKSKTFDKNGIKLFEQIKKLNLEGIVAKKKDSTYEINTRSGSWIKIKNQKKEEFIIGGYEETKGYVISLLLGEYRDNEFCYVGNVALAKKSAIYNKLMKLQKMRKSPFNDYKKSNAIYVSPIIKVKIKYMERTKNNHLRQPRVIKEDQD